MGVNIKILFPFHKFHRSTYSSPNLFICNDPVVEFPITFFFYIQQYCLMYFGQTF